MRPELKRASECPLRRPLSCGDIDTSIGFVAMIKMERCDECWKAGGAKSPASVPIRIRLAEDIIAEKKSRGLEHYPRHVQLAIIERFMDPDEAAVAQRRIDEFNARPKEEPVTTWLGMKWYGEPMPRRIAKATAAAGKVFVRTLRNCKGCGCNKKLKDAASSLTRAVAGSATSSSSLGSPKEPTPAMTSGSSSRRITDPIAP